MGILRSLSRAAAFALVAAPATLLGSCVAVGFLGLCRSIKSRISF